MNSPKKVSVIIPCYNKAQFIEEAVKSVVNSTYKNMEIIIVNDASTDNSKQIIQKLAEKYNDIIFLDFGTNKGVVYARNYAIKLASGDYILPLDADDTIESTYIEKAVNILDKFPKVGVVGCRTCFDKRDNSPKGLIDYLKILYWEDMFVCTTLFRKSDFIKIGGYKECMSHLGCEDYELYLTFIEHGYKFYKINEQLFNYRRNIKNNRTKIQKENNYKIKKKIFELHADLFLKEDNIWILFSSLNQLNTIKQKYNKYKSLSNLLIVVLSIENLFVMLYFLYFVFHQEYGL